MHMPSRGTPQGFATRTLTNLDYIEEGRKKGDDVHAVTQRILSLLGLVIFPHEKQAFSEIESRSLAGLEHDGWPTWKVTLDEPPKNKTKTATLGRLLEHFRNAVAHGRVSYAPENNADSRNPTLVTVVFEDAPNHNASPNWRASISADDLLEFCRQLSSRLNAS